MFPILPFAFDFSSKQWTQSISNHVVSAIHPSKLKIATFNILQSEYSFIRNCILRPLTRFASTISMIANSNDPEYINADIISLNEVDSTFLTMLMNDPLIQKHFFLSEIVCKDENSNCKFANRSIVSMGNILLSRIPFEACYSLPLPDNCDRNVTIGVFCNQSLVVASIHPTAYQHLATSRANQLEFVFDELNFSNSKELFKNSSVFAIGDMNLHLSEENQMLKNKNIIDLYHETVIVPFMEENSQIEYPPLDEHVLNYPYGFTWNLFPLDNRKMRLDRMLRRSNVRNGTPMLEWVPNGPVRIFAQEKIAKSYYLRRSDHYGLAVEIEWRNVDEPILPNKKFAISSVTLPCEKLSKFFMF